MIARSPKWTRSLVAAAVGCSLPLFARAEEPVPAPAATPAPAPAPEPAPAPAAPPSWNSLVTVSGMVDAYYQYNFLAGAPNSGPQVRAFDVSSNSFQLSFAKLTVATQTAPAGFRLDLAFGPTADLASFDGPTKVVSEVSKMFEQAYGTFALPSKITLDVGKFTTWAGAEVIEAKDNWLYSRSMLFLNGPYTHTGVRAQWQVSDALVLKFAVVNGWEVLNDNNAQKSIGAAIAYTVPGANTAIALTTYQGVEVPFDTTLDPLSASFTHGTGLPWRQYYDLVIAQPIGDKLSLNLNAAAQLQDKNSWFGAALMAQFIPSSMLKIAARFEHFQDLDGAQLIGTAGVAGKNMMVDAGTLTLGFPVGSNGEFRVEGRADFASVPFYGYDPATPKQQQVSATVAALAWF